MIKHIYPNPFLSDYKSSNLTIVNNNSNLILTPINPNNLFWIVFGINKAFNPVQSFDLNNWKLILQGTFQNNISVSFNNINQSFELYENQSFYSYILDFINNINVRHIQLTGKINSPIIINRLTLEHPKYIKPKTKKKIHFIYKPFNEDNLLRKGEKDILDHIDITDNIDKNTTIYVRPIAELVTKQNYEDISNKLNIIKKECPDCKIINDIKYFYNHNIKNFTFDIWNKNNIPHPNYKIVNSINDINEFIDRYDKCILRINNSWGGRNSYVVHKNSGDKLINKFYNELLTYKTNQINNRFEYVDIIIVNKIPPVKYDKSLILNVGRSYIVNNKIINSHSFVHNMTNDLQLVGSVIEPEDFVTAHKIVLDVENKYRDMIINSVNCLDIQIGCVDYIINDKFESIFLEVNAFWGMGTGINSYPYSDNIKKYLINNYDNLINIVPNIYERMDEYNIWKKFYERI